MKVGYIRANSKNQNVTRKVKSLKEYGCEKIFIDEKSGKDSEREQYKKMKEFICQGDVVVFAELDRLGSNKEEVDREWNDLIEQGIDVVVLGMPVLDTTKFQQKDEIRKLILNLAREIISYIVEQDRLKLERQLRGISIAKKEGKYKGTDKFYRPDSPNPIYRDKYHRMVQLLKQKLPIKHIAEEVNVSRNTVYRIQKELNKEESKSKNYE